MKTLNRVVFAILLTLATGLVSFFLAELSEAVSLKLGCLDCTLGMVVASRLAQPDQPHAVDVFARRLSIGVAIDTSVLFLIIGGILITVAVRRRRRRNA